MYGFCGSQATMDAMTERSNRQELVSCPIYSAPPIVEAHARDPMRRLLAAFALQISRPFACLAGAVNSGHRLATHDAEEARISGLDGPVGGWRWDPALVRLAPFTSPRDRQICQYPARRRSN